MRNWSYKTERRRGQTMIALMITVLILIGLYMAFLGSRQGDDGELRPSVAKQSIDRGQEVVLENNLSQIQQIISMYKSDNGGKPPASLDELKTYSKFPAEMFINPVDKKPLGYDPATGTMIVTPYEGMSRMINRTTANPMHGADQPVAPQGAAPPTGGPPAPGQGGGPGGVRMPVVPNSGSAPESSPDDSQ